LRCAPTHVPVNTSMGRYLGRCLIKFKRRA